jgi:hypothetical protein
MFNQTAHDAYRRRELLRLRRSLNRIQDEALLLRRDIAARKLRQRKFNPDQPRVPAGNGDGGQWTSGGGSGGGSGLALGLGLGFGEGLGLGETVSDGLFVDPTGEASWSSFSEGWSEDGSIFERDIVNRDGSTIQSEYAAAREAGFDERQTVRLASGETTSFETTDRVQTIRYGGADGEVISRSIWTPSGPEPDATVQPVLLGPLQRGVGAAGAILFGWESQRNGLGGGQAVMGFNAWQFTPETGTAGLPQLAYVGRLSDEEVERACLRWPDVKSFADRAANAAGSVDLFSSAAVYGTNVHTRFKVYVEDAHDPFFRAERSFWKESDESRILGLSEYGRRGTIRVDAYEYRDDGTLCVYDLKTGRASISNRRAEILATAAAIGLAPIRRVIVSEVRP